MNNVLKEHNIISIDNLSWLRKIKAYQLYLDCDREGSMRIRRSFFNY